MQPTTVSWVTGEVATGSIVALPSWACRLAGARRRSTAPGAGVPKAQEAGSRQSELCMWPAAVRTTPAERPGEEAGPARGLRRTAQRRRRVQYALQCVV